MDTLLLNSEETPGAQLQNLIMKLVKQQVEEQMKQLQHPLPPALSKPPEPNQEKVFNSPANATSPVEYIIHEKQEPKKLCEEKIKKLIREMTPKLKRRQLPLLIQARMLIHLYEHRESGIAPSLLFSYSKTGTVAGYRYIAFFKERGYLGFIGARQNGKYILTDKGRGQLETI